MISSAPVPGPGLCSVTFRKLNCEAVALQFEIITSTTVENVLNMIPRLSFLTSLSETYRRIFPKYITITMDGYVELTRSKS